MSQLIEHDLDPEELEQIEQEEEEDVFDSSSQGSSSQTSTLTWIENWFCSLPGHDYFCEVHEDFIEDEFNLTGLHAMVPFWREAIDMVLDVEPDSSKIPDVSIVENSAEVAYGLCHARFILTKAGLTSMYEEGHFGVCPRVFCLGTHVLPCGRSDHLGEETVKLFCPNCGDIFSPPSSKHHSIDGAYFGTTFPALFFQTYPELLSQPFFANPANTTTPSTPGSSAPSPRPNSRVPVGGETITNPNPYGGHRPAYGRVYQPKIFGFNVSERARSGPRMRWLRERPNRAEELDTVDIRGRFIDLNRPDSRELEGKDNKAEKKGRLFDDEDDEIEDEEEEEEEEEGQVQKGTLNPVPQHVEPDRRRR